jgi:uncharacterized protein (DUF58 family)
VPGDDRRHIHWRTSARVNKFMVREFIDNRRSHLALVVDTNPASYADEEEFELAVSMTGSLGIRALHDGEEMSCVAGARTVHTHSGQSLLDGLARVELGVPALSVGELAMRVSALVVSASVVVLLTGSAVPVPELQAAMYRLGAGTHSLCVRAALSDQGGLMRADRMSVFTADTLDTFSRGMWALGVS